MNNKWILTDDDSCQYVKKNTETMYELIEMGLINPVTELYEVYTDAIELGDYFNRMLPELLDILDGFGYVGLEDVYSKCKNDANQIIAECIFEHYGSFQANQRFVGTEKECREFVSNYISN